MTKLAVLIWPEPWPILSSQRFARVDSEAERMSAQPLRWV